MAKAAVAASLTAWAASVLRVGLVSVKITSRSSPVRGEVILTPG
jgi:hypothetical protein